MAEPAPRRRSPRRRLDRRGVKLVQLARTGGYVARWADPITGRRCEVSLASLGLSSHEARQRWATDKAKSLADLRAKLAAGHVVAQQVTVERAVAGYLATFENKRTEATKRIVLESVRDWLTKVGVRDCAQLTLPILLRWRDHYLRPANEHEGSTRNRWLTCVGAWLRWAAGRGMVPLLANDGIGAATKRIRQERKAIQFLRPEQLRSLLQAVARHDDDAEAGGWRPLGAFVLALLLSGGRYAEIAGLRWDEVHLADGYLELDAERVKTGASRRVNLDVTPALASLLRGLALRRGAAETVFGTFTYGRTQCALARLVKDYGAPSFTPHTLRRSCGTVLTCSSVFGAAGAFLSAKRLGHGVQLAEASYVGALTGLPADARTFEAAAGIEAECDRIIAQNGGAPVAGDAETAAG